MKILIGVLALQGDFAKHQIALEKLGVNHVPVKTVAELQYCDGLIIPGGESTTLVTLMKSHGLWPALAIFGQAKPILGTCAGCIILAREVVTNQVDTLKLINITVARNAYGRQVDSFIDEIRLELNGVQEKYEGVFIRAPKIVKYDSSVQLLAWYQKEVVMVRAQHILAATFHPELTDNLHIHEYFVHMVRTMN